MLNHPEMEEQTPPAAPEKLVLPSQPDTPGTPGTLRTLRVPRQSADQFKAQVGPAQLIRPKASQAPNRLLSRLAYYWRKDPAYKVFMLAVVMVVLASIVFASMAGGALLGKPPFSSSYSPVPPTSVAPTGTVDLRPTFSVPGGGKGSSQSSQPPVHSTPVLSSTPSGDGSPTPTPTQSGNLTAQITDYSTFVPNNSRAFATVSTSEPDVTVTLYIRSNATPRSSTAGPRVTDSSGSTTIAWVVNYSSFGHRTVTLTVVAVAVDQNGQRTTSSSVTIQVLMQGLP